MLNPQNDPEYSPVHMKPVISPIVRKKTPLNHGLGHFQPYSPWSAPKMLVSGRLVRSSMGAAGYDLFAAEDGHFNPPPGYSTTSHIAVSTGVSVQIPMGHYGKIEGLSSLAFDHNVIVFGAIIDENHTGDIKVKMFKHGNSKFKIKKGDRIAQLVIQRYCAPSIQQVISM
jgi:dUTP pyrophosphatase